MLSREEAQPHIDRLVKTKEYKQAIRSIRPKVEALKLIPYWHPREIQKGLRFTLPRFTTLGEATGNTVYAETGDLQRHMAGSILGLAGYYEMKAGLENLLKRSLNEGPETRLDLGLSVTLEEAVRADVLKHAGKAVAKVEADLLEKARLAQEDGSLHRHNWEVTAFTLRPEMCKAFRAGVTVEDIAEMARKIRGAMPETEPSLSEILESFKGQAKSS